MITYRQLEHFVAVAQERHFSRAADRLGIAQSAVSVQIQQLEDALGVRLLQRHKRQPITLTDAGALLYEEAIATLRHMERAQEIGRLAAQGRGGHVRLGYVASAVTSGLLSRMLKQFRPGHEQVHMQVIAMETPRQLQAVEAAEIDVGVVRPRRQYPENVEATIIHGEPLMVAMAENHPLAGKPTLQAADLHGQTFIAPQFTETDAEGFAQVLARLAAAAGFSASPAYRVNDIITATSLAAAGYGIVVVPESNRRFNQPGVTYRVVSDFQERVYLALVYRKRENSPAVRAFIAAARQSVATGL